MEENQVTKMPEEEEPREMTYTAENPAHNFKTLDNILETEAYKNNLIRLTNKGKVLIKLFKNEGSMGPQLKTFRNITDLEDWEFSSSDFQDKIACRLELMSTTTLHLTKSVK